MVVGEHTRPASVDEAVAAVRAQSFTDWELIVVGPPQDGRAPAPSRPDPRLRAVTVGAGTAGAAAANRGLELALGDFVVFLDPRDRLGPGALARVARAASVPNDDADFLYLDEDVAGPAAERVPVLRPDWSPERLRHGNYLDGFNAVRTSLARDLGGCDTTFGPAHSYDFVLRATEASRTVVHVPAVQFHRGPVHAPAEDAAGERRAVQAQLDRLHIDGVAGPGPAAGYHRVHRVLDPDVKVSIIIPTRGQRGVAWDVERSFVVESVRTALAKTDHQNLEIVLIHDTPTPSDVLDEVRAIVGDRLVTVAYDAPFNFSEKCNLAFLHSRGEVIVLLNDDVHVISERWLETLVAPLSEPDVGLTGAKLLYPDGTLQHAGHVYSHRTWDNAYPGRPADFDAELGSLLVNREASGVTAACAAMRRETYEAVGGLTERLPGNYNDVDLSLKVRYLGLRVLWLADCELFHFESRTRERTVHQYERAAIRERWGSQVRDAYLPWLP
jgi:GT2 family glycosyltransferase